MLIASQRAGPVLVRRITRFAAEAQRQGKRPKESKRYCAEVVKLKGYIKTEGNRILNRIVEQKRPGMFVVERLVFRNPALSRRLNRVIRNCGRKTIKAKLAAIEEVLGVPGGAILEAQQHGEFEVNPAYTSQECSNYHYVDKRNRRDRDHFHCLWCGLKLHADVNGARTTGIRRSGGQLGSVHRHRGKTLDRLVRQFTDGADHARWAGLGARRSPLTRGLLTLTFWVIPAFSSGRPRGGGSATQTMGQ